MDTIVGGDVNPSHSAVVAIHVKGLDLCSGIVIAPRVVLTAGHCVWGLEPADLVVTIGENSTNPESSFTASRIALYPAASSSIDDFEGGVDLAVIELTDELGVPPIALAGMPPDELQGRDVTLVGFGRVDPFDATSAGSRHSVSLPISRVCARTIETGDDLENSCEGDSGGAVLLDGELFAVISAGRSGCNTPGVQVRVDAHRAWIARVIEGAFDDVCPSCLGPDDRCDAPVDDGSGPAGSAGTGAVGAVDAPTPSTTSGGCAVPPDGARWAERKARAHPGGEQPKGMPERPWLTASMTLMALFVGLLRRAGAAS